MKYCSSGIANLDEILGGGLPKPSLILIAGTAGAGKTTFALQSLSAAAMNGEKAVYIPVTSNSMEKIMDYLHTYPFFSDDIIIRPLDRAGAEKDPLTALLDIGNILATTNPDRLVINPLTTLGFGFASKERRRFFYSFNAMLQDWSAQTMVTGELDRHEVHDSILPHISEGVIYMDREIVGDRVVRRLEIMKMRGTETKNHLSSIYEFRIKPQGISIFPKLESISDIRGLSGNILSTGIEGLDSMMHGGLADRSLVLVVGGPGVGKTLMGLQFTTTGLEKGEPCVIVLFEEGKDQLIYEASRLGWNLQEFLDRGLLKLIHSDPDTISPDEHNLMIRECVEEIGAKRLFFDGIFNLKSVISDPYKLKHHVRLLTDFLKSRGVTMMFSDEITELFTPDKMPEIGMSSLADAIILLRYADGQDRFDRALSILKLRGSDHDRSVRKYTIKDNGIELVQRGLPD